MRFRLTLAFRICLCAASCIAGCGGADRSADVLEQSGDGLGLDASTGLPMSASCLGGGECAPPGDCVPLGEGALCLAACESSAGCSGGTSCSDDGWCAWTVGTVGEACSPELPCHGGLECAEIASGSFCTRKCDWDLPCPPGESARCVKLAQGGNYCLRNCPEEGECALGLKCTPLTEWPGIGVCYP